MDPSIYATVGEHHLVEHHRIHAEQRSNIYTEVNYGNKKQLEMQEKAKSYQSL